jgi:hypothetical protein
MKAFALIFASLALAPACLIVARGGRRECWSHVAIGVALAAVAYGAVRYLTA